MKVAVFIPGFLRLFKETKKNHNQFLFNKLKDCDVFIHTWDKSDCESDLDNFEDSVESLFRPKKIVFEPYFEFDALKYPNNYGRCSNVLSMYYKFKKAFELIPKNEYDVAIRLRTDHFFLNGPTDADFKLAIASGKLLFPKTNINQGVNDQFAIAKMDVMEKYVGVFDKIDEYYNSGVKIDPELLLSTHLRKENVKTAIANVAFTDYTYNGTFKSSEAYIEEMKKRHEGLIL